ncbi:DUF4352 domain-containing protein [Exiguobacterium sp. s70]|jgi:hypothetical protein|uniref:DUF4352 domain-containing protein n=1 Tax=Exiguobacterium sp. s70 TaxID=2751228 RepID=UPI002037565A|nr:DUF4352 domain-containing protein [Exiguobacterium sp. s70]
MGNKIYISWKSLEVKERIGLKSYGFILAIPLLVLVGCGDTEPSSTTTEPTNQSESVPSTDSQKETTETETVQGEEFEVQEDEIGRSQIYMKNSDLGIEETIGPIIFQIDKVQTLRLEVASDYRFFFDDQKEVTIVSFNVIVENTSDETVSFHPNQARLVTNTGEQVDADIVISEDVGGEFLGKVKKEGGVLFHVESMPEELTEVRFVVEGPYNDQFHKIAEERYEYTIDVTK